MFLGLDVTAWLLLIVAATCIGLAKSGFSGISLISIFILTELFGAKEQVGIALPMLIVGDLIVFPAFRKYGNWKEVWFLLPPTIVGGAVAFFILAEVDNTTMRRGVGAIVLLMVVMQALRKWKPEQVYKVAMHKGFGLFAGVAGGVATVLANAAGPIQQLYLLSKRMSKMDMLGVGARFFLIVNIAKLPLLGSIQLVDHSTLLLNLFTVPAIIAGVLLGKRIIHLIPQNVFEKLIVCFAAIAAVRLLFF